MDAISTAEYAALKQRWIGAPVEQSGLELNADEAAWLAEHDRPVRFAVPSEVAPPFSMMDGRQGPSGVRWTSSNQ